MDLGTALTLALLAALLGQAWVGRIPLREQVRWLVAVLMLNAMALPAAILLLGDAHEGLALLAGFFAVLMASATAVGALIWLWRIERLHDIKERDTQDHG